MCGRVCRTRTKEGSSIRSTPLSGNPIIGVYGLLTTSSLVHVHLYSIDIAFHHSIINSMRTPSNCLTATETQALLASGQITTDQILEDHRTRYHERDEKVKAWICADHNRASKENIEGELRGVVIGIKDIIGAPSPILD